MGFPENATTETLNGFSTEKLKPYVPPEQVNEPARKDGTVKHFEEPREVTIKTKNSNEAKKPFIKKKTQKPKNHVKDNVATTTTKNSKATQKSVKKGKNQKSKIGNSGNDKVATTEKSNAKKPVKNEKKQKPKIADRGNPGNDVIATIATTKKSKATQKPVKKKKTQKPKNADKTASNQKSSARNKHASFFVSMAATVFALLPVIAVR